MNIPCLMIRNINGHSHIPLKKIIQDVLANSCTFESIFSPPQNKKIPCLNKSVLCKNLNNQFLCVGNTVDFLITRWSDYFKRYNIKSMDFDSLDLFKEEGKKSTTTCM